MLILDSNNL